MRPNSTKSLIIFDVDSTLAQSVSFDDRCFARAVERQRKDAVVCYLRGSSTQERLALFKEATGLGRRPFYDRINEAKQSGLFDHLMAVNL